MLEKEKEKGLRTVEVRKSKQQWGSTKATEGVWIQMNYIATIARWFKHDVGINLNLQRMNSDELR